MFGVSWNWGPFSTEDDREGRELIMDPSLSACTAERPPTEMQLGTGLCRHSCCRHPFTCLGEKSFLVGLPALLPGGIIYCYLLFPHNVGKAEEDLRVSKEEQVSVTSKSFPSSVTIRCELCQNQNGHLHKLPSEIDLHLLPSVVLLRQGPMFSGLSW